MCKVCSYRCAVDGSNLNFSESPGRQWHLSGRWMRIRVQYFDVIRYITATYGSWNSCRNLSYWRSVLTWNTSLKENSEKKNSHSLNRDKISSMAHERVKNKLRSRDVPLVLSLLVVKCLNDLIPAHASLPDLSLCSYCHSHAPTLNAPFSNSPPVPPANRWSADEIEGQICDVITVHCNPIRKGGSVG